LINETILVDIEKHSDVFLADRGNHPDELPVVLDDFIFLKNAGRNQFARHYLDSKADHLGCLFIDISKSKFPAFVF
jgi:hypothetical protein